MEENYICKITITTGADRGITNENGETPFQMATDPQTARHLRVRPTSQFLDTDYVNADDDEQSD